VEVYGEIQRLLVDVFKREIFLFFILFLLKEEKNDITRITMPLGKLRHGSLTI
jgi:hypothetical protein